VLVISAVFTCAGVSLGNWALMSATMPATTALAALVLCTGAYPPVPLAAVTRFPAPVPLTYDRWLE
jgi:hypothetical protein